MNTETQRQLGAHWLAFQGVLNPGQGNLLTDAVRIAHQAGATIFEIVGKPLNFMSAKEAADAVLLGGISEVSYCRFFPGDGSFGDPIGECSPKAFAEVLKTFDEDFAYIQALQGAGLRVRHITGPSCFVLGRDYDEFCQEEIVTRAISFYDHILPQVGELNLQINIEYLRPEEDKALGGLEPVLLICRALGPRFRWHADTFHMYQRRLNAVLELRAAGTHETGESMLGYLHAHGFAGREIPGRNKNAWVHDNSRGWEQIGLALRGMNYEGPIVAEPFGQVVREQIPVLGEGLPPAVDPEKYYRTTLAYLKTWLH
ncbi:MAG: Xylose isomerase-like barrel [Candidatus Parcubacteria bacterium]|jgi:sugar phosphate isomerase/epimerase